MKIMVTSFKRSHANTDVLSALNPATAHHWPTSPPESPGHSQESLGQSLLGSLLLSPGSWCTQALFELSGHFWWLWDLILNAILPLLPSCWGFSVLGCVLSPQSHFSALQPPGAAHFIYVIISPGLCLFNVMPGLLNYNHCISTANQKFLEKPVTWFHSAEKLQLMLWRTSIDLPISFQYHLFWEISKVYTGKWQNSQWKSENLSCHVLSCPESSSSSSRLEAWAVYQCVQASRAECRDLTESVCCHHLPKFSTQQVKKPTSAPSGSRSNS